MTRRLHVLEIAKSTGGVGEYVRWVVEGLDKERFQFTVACLSEGGPELAAHLNRLPGVQALALAMNRFEIDPVGDARAGWALARLMRQNRFDLIHAHASKPGFLARAAAAGIGVPVLYSAHGFAFHEGTAPFRAAVFGAVERLAARWLTTRIIAVCNEERDRALRFGVGRPEQYQTVYAGVELSRFGMPMDGAALRGQLGIPAAAPLIGAVGRLNTQKSPLDFVRMAVQVRAVRPETHFIWIGSGALESAARQLATEQGMAGQLHFAGQRSDVPALLAALDGFVLSSRWEGFSLSILEAMAAGLPVVATRVTGAAEAVVAGETGWLVPPANPDALAAAVLALLGDPARARQMGAAGRQRVAAHFTRAHMLAQLDTIYRQSASLIE
ncbi:MAG: glycosyltransferase family 4 protein [Anaerolineales bacterium]|nr:glycosyltransferase family 4 protein [Anaerolineales bacterium]